MKERPPHPFTVLPWSWPSESLLHRGTKWFVWMVHLAYNSSVSLREVVQGRALRREESAQREIEITLFFFAKRNCSSSQCNLQSNSESSSKVKGRKQFSSTAFEVWSHLSFSCRYLEVLAKHTHVWLLVITVRVLHLPSPCSGRVTVYW